MPLLSFPDSISLVFCFLILDIVKRVFLDSVFSFRIESKLNLRLLIDNRDLNTKLSIKLVK